MTMDGSHYTPGWGALATVIVAVIAVLVSIYTNKKTLDASAVQFEKSQRHAQNTLNTSIAQFRQLREDTRVDKLRIEIIGLINALAERTTRLDIAVNRIDEALDRIAKIDFTEVGAPDLDRADRAMRASMAEEFWEVYARVTAHAFAIRLLTTDASILRIVNDIQEAIALEREHYEFAVIRGEIHKRDKADIDASQLDDQLRDAAKALLVYSLKNLVVRPTRLTTSTAGIY